MERKVGISLPTSVFAITATFLPHSVGLSLSLSLCLSLLHLFVLFFSSSAAASEQLGNLFRDHGHCPYDEKEIEL